MNNLDSIANIITISYFIANVTDNISEIKLLQLIIALAYITEINRYENSIHICEPCVDCRVRNIPISTVFKSGTYITPMFNESVLACKNDECSCLNCQVMKTPISLEKSGINITDKLNKYYSSSNIK